MVIFLSFIIGVAVIVIYIQHHTIKALELKYDLRINAVDYRDPRCRPSWWTRAMRRVQLPTDMPQTIMPPNHRKLLGIKFTLARWVWRHLLPNLVKDQIKFMLHL
jgi:hypothetical protein